jgi:hypothetical protein
MNDFRAGIQANTLPDHLYTPKTFLPSQTSLFVSSSLPKMNFMFTVALRKFCRSRSVLISSVQILDHMESNDILGLTGLKESVGPLLFDPMGSI